MSPKKLTKVDKSHVLDLLRQQYQGRGGALIANNPFELLVAVMLSAQTNDNQVNKVTPQLFADHPTPEAIALLTPETVHGYIKTIGLANNKSKNLVALAQKLVTEFDSQVPQTREALVTLPGVGRKTANVVLANAFGIPAIPVDTHVHRVSNRIGLVNASTVEETEQQLEKVIPKTDWVDSHHWLIWFGREQCKAQSPNCANCTIESTCLYVKKTT